MISTFKRLFPIAIAASLFLIIIGAKWRMIELYGSDMPDWDQWDAEGMYLYPPWFANEPFLQALFTPHNEHRVVLTKLQSLAQTLAGGQWDARVQTMCNAVLHTVLAVALFMLGRRWLAAEAPRMNARANLLLRGLWFLVVAACFALSPAWQNTLGGFHSQQYWLLGLSLITLVILPFTHPRQGEWWLGLLAGSVVLLSMCSGLLAAAAVLVVLTFRIIRRSATLREAWPTVLVCVALCAVGWLTRKEVDYHTALRARSVGEFFLYTLKSLQWPVLTTHLGALLLWLPWVGVVVQAWRQPTSRVAATLAGVGGWVLLQIIATAYTRGAGADWPAYRYMDTLLFGLVVNGLAMLWLATRISPGARWKWTAGAAFIALWMTAIGYNLNREMRGLQDGLHNLANRYRQAEENTRAFLATNDIQFLERPDVPYPGAPALKFRLEQPGTRQLMPVSMRIPVRVTTRETSGFVVTDSSHQPPYLGPVGGQSGISPATAPLTAYQVFGSFTAAGGAATGSWQSAPLRVEAGTWLKFETAGALGDNGDPKIKLALTDARTGERLAEVQAKRAPGDHWRAVYVEAPDRPFTITATDESTEQWLAFTAPTEMSPLSYRAWRLSKASYPFIVAGVIASLLLGAAALLIEKERAA